MTGRPNFIWNFISIDYWHDIQWRIQESLGMLSRDFYLICMIYIYFADKSLWIGISWPQAFPIVQPHMKGRPSSCRIAIDFHLNQHTDILWLLGFNFWRAYISRSVLGRGCLVFGILFKDPAWIHSLLCLMVNRLLWVQYNTSIVIWGLSGIKVVLMLLLFHFWLLSDVNLWYCMYYLLFSFYI